MRVGSLRPRPFLAFRLVRLYSNSADNSTTIDPTIQKILNDPETSLNPFNIQLLPKSLTTKIFKTPNSLNVNFKDRAIQLAREHLRAHNVPFDKIRQLLPNISDEFVPELAGRDIDEHFKLMAKFVGGSYEQMAEDFVTVMREDRMIQQSLAEIPKTWPKDSTGWHKYDAVNCKWISISAPKEDVLVFDVETCPNESQFPVVAVGFTLSGWHCWLSPVLFEEKGNRNQSRLISLGLNGSTLCVGHNVSYDRARILEEYTIKGTNRRFLDTLSMHCSVSGISTQQRGPWKQNKQKGISVVEDEIEEEEVLDSGEECVQDTSNPESSTSVDKWGAKSAMNNLADAVYLHCGRTLDKSSRSLLIEGTIESVRQNYDKVMDYCARDVQATTELFLALLPKFKEKSPHPVTFTALLEMGSYFLPVNEGWPEYVRVCEEKFEAANRGIEQRLAELVEATIRDYQADDKYKDDPWLSKLDWAPLPAKYTKPKYRKDGSFAAGGEPRPIGNEKLFGKPAWYKKLYSSKLGGVKVTPKTQIVPYLLKIRWHGHPVVYEDRRGWCYYSEGKEAVKIPHPEGKDEANVGNLMTKHFMKYFESGKLTSESELVQQVMQTNSSFAFWSGYRERIGDQMVIWQDEPGVQFNASAAYPDKSIENALIEDKQETSKLGLILPMVIPMGTVTRRAVEKTWMTASNAKANLVGSELKAKIVAPPGYRFVGADVDSQELWISSLLSDAQFFHQGATAIGWMTLQGSKADKSDLHSRTAQILGMTRDNAKIFNYGRIYGAGVNYAAQLLQKFNPQLTREEADKRASDLYQATKGRRMRRRGQGNANENNFVTYVGGTESFMFNQMEAIARARTSQTPVLKCQISEGLRSDLVDENFLTSRVNWVVQSSGVDYLHLILVSMKFLCSLHGIKCRPSLTIHDELRFLVEEEDVDRAALALQISNLWTRALFVQAVGIDELPLSVAFFSLVDVDRVLRKEVSMSCLTPSNPNSIPPGYTLDIYQLLERCKSLGPVNNEINSAWKSFSKKMSSKPSGLRPAASLTKLTGLPVKNEQQYLTTLERQMIADTKYSNSLQEKLQKPANSLRSSSSSSFKSTTDNNKSPTPAGNPGGNFDQAQIQELCRNQIESWTSLVNNRPPPKK